MYKIWINGDIQTMDETLPKAEAMVVKDERLVFVGGNQQALEYSTDDSELHDLEGKYVLPGFIDGHLHLTVWRDIAKAEY